MSGVRVRVKLIYHEGRVVWHDAARARLDGDEIVIERHDGTVRVPSAALLEWSVRRADDLVADGIARDA
jgi:hypothetical protein